ncbi:c-type cytochrome [Variovorax sp. M-6]|uniref:c-type cytochrome n=1 Tax=Variovorax sp. M-6 TaxID=3233041 RepID=UPI003F9999ED
MRLTMARPLMLIAGLLLVAAPAAADERAQTLARQNGCMSCHGMVHKQVGPGFAQVAARYRADAAAPSRLAGRIRSGSVGTWGRVIMPRQPQVSEAEAKLLAQWVLAQPSPP